MSKYQGNPVDFRDSRRDWSDWIDDHIRQSCNGVGPHSEYAILRPALSEEMLERMPKNRKLKSSQLSLLRRHCEQGTITLTPDGLGFTYAGHFVNGQHRCTVSISESAPIPVFVCFGLSEDDEDIVNIDQVIPKSAQDVLSVWGPIEKNASLTVASLKVAHVGWSGAIEKLTTRELREIANRHADALESVVPLFSKARKGVRVAPVVGAVIRAYYHERIDKLRRFVEMLLDVDMAPESASDMNALKFRCHLQERADHTGNNASRSKYRKAEYVIHESCNGKAISRIRESTRELYPLPEEDE